MLEHPKHSMVLLISLTSRIAIFAENISYMKYLFILMLGVLLASCGTKIPYTNQIRDEFGLDSEKQLRKVQFYTSSTLIMEKSKSSEHQGTNDGGVLVTSSSKQQNRIIIPTNTRCVFEEFGPNGELVLRFEVGAEKTLTFAVRPNQTAGKYYIVADWTSDKGGKLTYGNETLYISSFTGNTFLKVALKKLQKTKRKDRVVRGMKI